MRETPEPSHLPLPTAGFAPTKLEGRGGHPVILPPKLVARLASLEGDKGAAGLLSGSDVILVPFEDDRALLDLDTPEDWDAWRRSTEA